jgi:hypothetical protein
MALRGPKNKEDYMFLYMLNSKAIELPDGPLWKPADWGSAKKEDRTMARGFFNPNHRYYSTKPDKSFSFSSLLANVSPQTAGMPNQVAEQRAGLVDLAQTNFQMDLSSRRNT